MKRFTIVHPLWMSFFSESLYQDVGKNWPGLAFTYLLLLLALVWIPPMVKMQIGLAHFVDKEAPPLIRQIPSIQIKKGEVSTEVPTPYFIKDPQSGKPAAIIDLTGQYTTLDNSEASVLITKTRLIVKSSSRKTDVYDLSSIQNFSLNRDEVESWAAIFKNWFIVVAYPLALLVSFAYRIVQALVYAAIGLVFAKILRASLNYPALVRLAVVAVTPVLWLDGARDLLGMQIAFWRLICFGIAMGYLFYGVRACSLQEAAQQASRAGTPSGQPE
jgi:hypothetical protein